MQNARSEIRTMVEADLPKVTSLHISVFQNNRSTLLGKRFVQSEYKWFLTNFPELSLVFEKDQIIIGFIIGAEPNYPSILARTLWREIFISLLTQPWLIIQSKTWIGIRTYLNYLSKSINPIPMKKTQIDPHNLTIKYITIELASIGVSPRLRGKGIAGLLLTAFELKALELGAHQLRLTVANNNFSARKAYEKAGWEMVYERDTVGYKKLISRSI